MNNYIQVKEFNAKKMGHQKGYSLKNMREGFGIPWGRFPAVVHDIKWQKEAKALHDLSTLPLDVDVPIYCKPKLRSLNRLGFCFVMTKDGRIYADGKLIKNTKAYIEKMKLGFKLYWGEFCDGVRVVCKESL